MRRPGRKYAGAVFQGDSIHALIAQLKSALDTAPKYSDDDLNVELKDSHSLLTEAEDKRRSVRAT